jgi:hypothetical protein
LARDVKFKSCPQRAAHILRKRWNRLKSRTARSLRTTARYTHVSAATICSTCSPLDLLPKTVEQIQKLKSTEPVHS